ncbi:hypothetical protein F2Q69_00003719 [Brassica cretica]|uniref:Fe2OG dioxygenase domain-containing protein n=1 Tax=Brassica cretica TaxID=69181 RepID=A0A8S9PL07_BRACR|nr:hypothetical protein F2Q69_00003719 [Brassica cretica]
MSSDQREAQQETTVDGGGTTTMRATAATTTFSSQRLRINPNNEHRPESYEDLKLDFPSAVYSSLEKYLPQQILVSSREEKVKFMTDIMLRHLPHGERSRAQRHSVYRQKIITNYQPLHKELYTLAPMHCFVPSFIKAINESSEKSFRSIISEPSPGVFVFDMLQPSFCEMMLAEVENFEKWVGETKFRIMRPNTMNKYGAVLDDFGLDSMLDKLMESFIRPMTKVLTFLTWVLVIAQRHSVYRQKIITNYQPLHKELYTLAPMHCFVPSFIKAINESSEKSFRSIISEPSPGVFVFDMLQPSFCEMMLAEVENFEKWVGETKFRIMRPNTMNKYGAVLDDFGLDSMLDKLMESFIRPMTKVFFSDVGGATLDSHHGFVVEYGKDRDLDLGFHVDDSEVTLNVCLGNQFVGGELFFRGTRCERHVNTTTKPDEIYDYSHVPGQAVLHRGRHRHGARATTSGHRVNMLLWCRSSVFRELKSHQKEFSSWCGECFCEKKEEKGRALDALRQKLVKAVRAPQA